MKLKYTIMALVGYMIYKHMSEKAKTQAVVNSIVQTNNPQPGVLT